MQVGPNPSGLCMCGCGEHTPLSKRTRLNGDVKGQPTRYLLGHNRFVGTRKRNRFEHLADGTTAILLEYKGQTLKCVIDTSDFDLIKDYTWVANNRRDETFYARTILQNPRRNLKMEHVLLPPKDGLTPDHIDRSGMNNRRLNLRYATKSQQTANQKRRQSSKTSQYRGVSWNKDTNKWRAQITAEDRKNHLGLFSSEVDAAKAFDAAALKYYGEFASLNFPEQMEAR